MSRLRCRHRRWQLAWDGDVGEICWSFHLPHSCHSERSFRNAVDRKPCYTSCAFDCSSTLAFGLANQPPSCAEVAHAQIAHSEAIRLKNIFVGNLDFNTSEDELRKLFEVHGQVDRVSIMTDRDTGRSRGFGFVEMTSGEDGEKAIAALNGTQIGGRTLNVNEARPKVERGGGGGGGGGRDRGGRGGGHGGGGGGRRDRY
jgi:cold-inducible RNA-binding protein